MASFNMTKFFRKYSRQSLMVIMALLLVAFLLEDVLRRVGSQSAQDEKVGAAFGGQAIYQSDLARNDQDIEVCVRVGMVPTKPTSQQESIDMYLAMQEAARSGVRIGHDTVMNQLRAGGMTDARMKEIQTSSHRSYADIYDCIGRLMAVRMLSGLQAAGVGISFPQVEMRFRDQSQLATVQVSVLDAKVFLPSVPQPTEEELLAFFEANKSRATRHTTDKLEFGYILPDRVRVEYLTIDPLKLLDRVEIREPDARRFWEENQNRYQKTVEIVGADPTEDGQQSSTRVPQTYEEAREQVRKDYRRQLAVEMAQRRMNELYAQASEPWRGQAPAADGYRPVPSAGVISFEELRAKAPQDIPIEYVQGELSDRTNLARKLPDLLQAFTTEGGGRMRAGDLAFRVRGIYTPVAEEAGIVLNVNEPAPLLFQLEGNRPNKAILMRVVEVKPTAPPETLAEVREKLVEDWRMQKAYELAGAEAQKLADRAKVVGLAAAAKEATSLIAQLEAADVAASQPAEPGKPAPQSPPNYVRLFGPRETPFTRGRPFLPEIGAAPSLSRAIFDLAEAPPSATAPAFKVALAANANRFQWLVGQLDGIRPLYQTAFDPVRPQIIRQLREAERSTVESRWLATEAIRERTGFVPVPSKVQQ